MLAGVNILAYVFTAERFLDRPLQHVFLLPIIPWIAQGVSTLLVLLLYDLCYAHTILGLRYPEIH